MMRTHLFSLFTVVQQQLGIKASEYVIFMIERQEIKQKLYFTTHFKKRPPSKIAGILNTKERNPILTTILKICDQELSLQYKVYIHNVRFTLGSTLIFVS